MQTRHTLARLTIIAGTFFCVTGCGHPPLSSGISKEPPDASASRDSTHADPQKVLDKWGIVELPRGEGLNVRLPDSKVSFLIVRTQEEGDSVYLHYGDREVYKFVSRGPVGAPSSTYFGGVSFVGAVKPKGTVWIDHDTDGRFDTRLEFGGEHRGLQIWYGDTWILTTGNLEKAFKEGVKDSQGNVYRFDAAKGAWVVCAR